MNQMKTSITALKNERVLARGITISNDTRKTGLNNNDLIIGASGSGKTGGYVIPNIQALSGSLVVSDTKGNLCRRFSRELECRGFEVATLDFVDPLKSCGYNPLDAIRRYPDGSCREQDVLTLADTLMPRLDAKEPFWEKAAASYLSYLIALTVEMLAEDEQNMMSVCGLHHSHVGSQGGIPSIVEWIDGHRDSFAAKRYCEIKSSMAAEKMWSSIMEFANIALRPFGFREADRIFGGGKCFDIRSLGQRKTVLFLNVSDTDRAFDQIVNMFYTQALQVLCAEADKASDSRLKVPVRIIMDDFATNAKIPDFDKVISVLRSREISVSLILQSLTQLDSMYGKDAASTIVNGCDHILFLGSQDLSTAEYVGHRVNRTPGTVLCKPREKAYLLTNGEEGRLVDKVAPYSTVAAAVEKSEREEMPSRYLAG